MHDHTKLTQDRIGHLKERLEREITEEICPLQVTAWQVPGEPVSFKEAAAANYQPFPPGTWWVLHGAPGGCTLPAPCLLATLVKRSISRWTLDSSVIGLVTSPKR